MILVRNSPLNSEVGQKYLLLFESVSILEMSCVEGKHCSNQAGRGRGPGNKTLGTTLPREYLSRPSFFPHKRRKKYNIQNCAIRII